MSRWLRIVGLVAAALLPSVAAAKPDIHDTKLLSQPTISSTHVAFVYADDIWVSALDGQSVRRLTSDVGLETQPFLSPDGKWVAFSGQYDGNTDVYIIPVEGGSPKRLTYHPGSDLVRGWAPDSKSVLFASARSVHTRRYTQLFTVSIDGGFPTQLPIPWGNRAAYSPDGSRIAYTPNREVFEQWKNYRGGTNARIWIFECKDNSVVQVPQPATRCNDTDPQWLDGGTIIFRSDRNGEFNLFTYNLASKEVNQVTKVTDFPVLDVSTGGGNVVYEQAGYLHRMRIGANAVLSPAERLKIGVATDLPETRARYVKGTGYIRGASVSPSGFRAVLEVRGEIVTVPAEKGDPRNLTSSPGVHERDPDWSPDGKTIAYFSDASGNYELCLTPQDGKGATKRYPLPGSGYYMGLVWSRDSKKLGFMDNAGTLYWADAESGKVTKVADSRSGRGRGLKTSSWSHDSKWLTYAMDNKAQISVVYVYSLDQNKVFPITDGLSEAADPAFDAAGKYLYFLGSTDTGMSKHSFHMSAADSRQPQWSIYMAVLRKELPSPFLRESDEEKGRSADAGAAPPGGATGGVPGVPGGEMSDEMRERMRAAAEARRLAKEPLKIDFEGLDQRILALPLSPGNYANLQAGTANQIYYLARSESGRGGGAPRGLGMGFGAALNHYDIERRRNEVVQPAVMSYQLTPDGRKMLYATSPDSWFIGPTSGSGAAMSGLASLLGGGSGGGGRPGRGSGGSAPPAEADSSSPNKRLNLDAIEIKIVPEIEWPQIFNEAWRINRDFFYASNMHGADWEGMKQKYRPFIDHCATRSDVNRIIQWMCSELAVGHHRGGGGDRLHDKKTVPGGLLGADYEIANGHYRFKKVFGGLNWSPELRAPLTAPGVNVKAGDYLLAVAGKQLKGTDNIYQFFENTSGKLVELTVGPSPDGKNSRTVTVEPIADEGALRNRDWVEGNLKKVHQATNGRVAYVYVPDTAGQGMMYFKRYFFPQIDKEAVIIDERYNGGGQLADYYIDILKRNFICYWAPRHGDDWRTPSAAIYGPKVLIIDENAGSGGDFFPWLFRKSKLGTIVGTRTWGGLVGVSGYPPLMDGGSITAPSMAIWTPEDGWIVENEGVPPDIEVEQTPADLIAGRDPQLEKAIAIALKELEKNPKTTHTRPAYPIRALPGSRPGGKQ
jgi:tricorn protease